MTHKKRAGLSGRGEGPLARMRSGLEQRQEKIRKDAREVRKSVRGMKNAGQGTVRSVRRDLRRGTCRFRSAFRRLLNVFKR